MGWGFRASGLQGIVRVFRVFVDDLCCHVFVGFLLERVFLDSQGAECFLALCIWFRSSMIPQMSLGALPEFRFSCTDCSSSQAHDHSLEPIACDLKFKGPQP